MIDFSEADIQLLAIHLVGEESVSISHSLVNISQESTKQLLQSFVSSPFKQPEYFSLHHEDQLEQNTVYGCVQTVFEDVDQLLEQSQVLVNHLVDSANSNPIKGELFVFFIADCIVEGELTDAVGLFLSTSKDTMLHVSRPSEGMVALQQLKGINVRKPDKACLIFSTEADFGYKVASVEPSRKSSDTGWWSESFLQIKPRENDFYHTKGHMTLCKAFVKDVLSKDDTLDRTEQVDIISKTRDYFAESELFDQTDFEEKIIANPEVVEQYREYKEAYEAEMGCNLKDSFTISADVAKQSKKFFRSVIKLDKNFHLYIHGGRDRVEKGFDDEKGMGYYKLYFDDEN